MAPKNSPRLVQLFGIPRAIAEVFRQPKSEIAGIEQTQQFGPLQPFKPMGGPGAEPWIAPLIPGQNLVYTPRARDVYTSRELREASMYDLVRIIIENVEDQVSRMPVNVRLKRLPGESAKDYAKRKPDLGKLKAIDTIIQQPNAEQNRSQFIRQPLDDMLVIDAASVLVRRNMKGGIYDFRAIDGAQIARYFDSWGATPQPPDPAYAQVWDAGQSGGTGIPWVDLRTDQLIYKPRNLKTYRLYGMSPLEQAIIMIRTGALRLQFQQDYYVAGSVPDAMQIVPTTVSTDKLKEAQKVLNAELSGILFKRRQIRLIQGFHEDPSKEQVIFPKEALLKDEFDDYVIRCLCYCFGTSPQRLQRVMGMRSGQVNQESAEKEGLEPWLDWVEGSIWNPMIALAGFSDYEVTYQEDTSVDPHTQAQIDDLSVKNGTKTVNEVREGRGDEPYPNVPEADEPLIIGVGGPVPLSTDSQISVEKKKRAAFPEDHQNDGQDGQGGNGQGGGKGKPVGKRRRPVIDPGHDTPARKHARARLEAACNKIFERQRHKATAKAKELLKVRTDRMLKDDQDPDEIADKIFTAVETEFVALAPEAREALQQAALSGINDAWLQIEITDTGLLAGANDIAAEYATKRAAELVGMKYDHAGELIPNPRAKWAISETTRDRLREIITNAFEEKTPFSELIDDIDGADIFSEKRAAMIARTEVSRAQVRSNMDVWKAAGVGEVEWLALGPDPCPICEDNDGEIRKIGADFPSGDTAPLAHPNCYCILRAVVEKGE